MCAGKSTVTVNIMKKDNFFLGSYDKIKWLISNYTRGNPEHRRMGREITFQAIAEAMNQGLSILIDGGHHEYRSRYIGNC